MRVEVAVDFSVFGCRWRCMCVLVRAEIWDVGVGWCEYGVEIVKNTFV